MRLTLFASILLSMLACDFSGAAEGMVVFSGVKKLNNLVSELLEIASISKSGNSFTFTRSSEGWIFVSAAHKGKGKLSILLEKPLGGEPIVLYGSDVDANAGKPAEAFRRVAQGEHKIRVDCEGDVSVDKLVVKSIPELVHCGLFNPAIKSYGPYDMEFLKKDVLPNVTGLIVPHNIKLPQSVIDDWHRQGKKFIAEVGLNRQGRRGEDNFIFYTNFMNTAPFVDGLIINEFGMNRSSRSSPERQERAAQRHRPYEEAFRMMRADDRYKDKVLYAYFGGSGNVVNYDDTGTTFCRTLIDVKYPIALERYIFERSSETSSADALKTFVDGIADWEEKEPGAKKNMLLSFGLFNAPPGGINKLPNVDYHVWMDQQMNVVANNPALADLGGLNWWTSSQADEDSVRFVGQLYRHYGIEGKTELLTKGDLLFVTHLLNADFEKGTDNWTLRPAEEGSIAPKSFPRYGRIEGRYMGLGRPADPEHIGDTFLWMKRSERGPNSFSQTVKDLKPGRLYSLKMFTCDYQDLVNPMRKTEEEATRFMGQVVIDGVEIDKNRTFLEMYASNPEPQIPVWITYHWTIFRAKAPTAQLTVSDWASDEDRAGTFGQEQTFNFLELQPYRE